LPLAILEAMCAKKPIVATNVGGVGEVVKTDITGKLIESSNTEKIVQAILELLSNRKKMVEYGENGYRLVSENFSISKTVTSYANLYTQLMC